MAVEQTTETQAPAADPRLARSPLVLAAQISGFAGFWVAVIALLAWWAVGAAALPYVVVAWVVSAAAMAAGVALNGSRLRAALAGRHAAHGATVMVATGLLLIVLVVANYVAARHPLRWDVTAAHQFALDQRTQKLLKAIDAPLEVYTYFPQRMGDPAGNVKARVARHVRDLLQEYRARQPKIRVEDVPPALSPAAQQRLFEKLGVQKLDTGSVILHYGDRLKQITWQEMVDLDRSAPDKQIHVKRFKAENALSSALRQLVQGRRYRIRLLTGHGEAPPEYGTSGADMGHVADDLRALAYDVAELPGPLNRPVPDDVDLLIIAGAAQPLSEREVALLQSYVQQGGNLLLTLRSRYVGAAAGRQDLYKLLAPYGIVPHTDVLTLGLDGKLQPLTRHVFAQHPIVHALQQGMHQLWFMPSAVLTIDRDRADDYQPVALVRGPANVYGERDYTDDGENAYDPEIDLPTSPILAAVAQPVASRKPPRAGRVLVLADTGFLSRRQGTRVFYDLGANADLFRNAVSWMLGVESNIGIGARENLEGRVNVSPDRLRRFSVVVLVLAPALVLALGLAVALMRRR